MRFSKSTSNIAAALSKVQGEIKNPIKNQINEGIEGGVKYENLADTLAEYVRPVLSKNGMSFTQSIKTDENGRVGVCTVLFHESGEFIESDYIFCDVSIPVDAKGNKLLTKEQATGGSVTYLRRYSLNAALGINGDKDTDGGYENWEEPLTYESALAYVLTFGQYKGRTLKEVWNKDIKYIGYLANNKGTEDRIKEAIYIIDTENKKREAAKKKGEATKEQGEAGA